MSAASQAIAGIKPGAETIDLQEGNSHGILLLHGFGDTPQTLALLAQDLHRHQFDVRVPLLPGHGTTVDEFIHSRRHDWIDCARRELELLSASHSRVSVAGLSMGGAIAALLAAERRDIQSLVLMSPYLDMPATHRVASGSFWLWGAFAGVRKSTSPRSILNPEERAKNLGYGVYSGRMLFELWKVASSARRALPRVTVPTLVIQSRNDPRISPEIAERALASLGAKEKKLEWVEGGHIITVDYGRDKVFEEVRSWITAHAH
jgi:carboxylesterase